MITLSAGQELFSMPGYYVYAGGDYSENDLVQVYSDTPELPPCQFQAKFIATGEFACQRLL